MPPSNGSLLFRVRSPIAGGCQARSSDLGSKDRRSLSSAGELQGYGRKTLHPSPFRRRLKPRGRGGVPAATRRRCGLQGLQKPGSSAQRLFLRTLRGLRAPGPSAISGSTRPLHEAASKGKADIVKLLLQVRNRVIDRHIDLKSSASPPTQAMTVELQGNFVRGLLAWRQRASGLSGGLFRRTSRLMKEKVAHPETAYVMEVREVSRAEVRSSTSSVDEGDRSPRLTNKLCRMKVNQIQMKKTLEETQVTRKECSDEGRSLESLIGRDYMSRDKDNHNQYSYVA
ncbi:unnamed protein product [Cyprideis torosa]|uniref:Uncharacterized protein n=1 Tax=Cyprideis torosa TaxID=163714 RepID=A0A7R8ZIA3_9CRUS|nr:unnamed protein product [Cyprideis torosa]CAG0885652.1 unnamed protein product [Cyprideis torosa]